MPFNRFPRVPLLLTMEIYSSDTHTQRQRIPFDYPKAASQNEVVLNLLIGDIYILSFLFSNLSGKQLYPLDMGCTSALGS